MAKKDTIKKTSKPSTTQKAKKIPLWDNISQGMKSDKTPFILGFICFAFAVFMCLAFVSFLITGSADQSTLESITTQEGLARQNDIRNYAGLWGAKLAEFFINGCFGYAAIFIPLFLLVTSLKLMHVARFFLWKWFIWCGSALVWFSIFFAVVGLAIAPYTFVYPGGHHGLWVSDWLCSHVGLSGTILLLTVTAICYLIYLSNETINWLRKFFRIGLKPLHRVTKSDLDNNSPSESTESENESSFIPTEDEKPIEIDLNAPVEKSTINITDASADATKEFSKAESSSFIVEAPTEELSEEILRKGQKPLKEESTSFTIEAAKNDDIIPDIEPYDPKLDLEFYKYPTIDLLKHYEYDGQTINMEEQTANKDKIVATLRSFGVEISSIKATVGPAVTLYEITPEAGVRITKIRNLEDDIALSLSALGIRIIAPIPGKGTIGIEVPNSKPRIVSMESIIASRKFQESTFELPVALGKTITNDVFMFDLTKAPHLLVAGATGQGKSVGLNAIIASLLYKKHPAELKFVLVDPKKVEFSIYSALEKHFMATVPDAEEPIITDVTKVIQTLNSLCIEMDTRYDLLKKARVRTIKEYNEKFLARRLNPNQGHKFMPYIVIIIDEFGDLIMTAGKEIELPIARIAQLARAVGMHAIIATQRPTTNIITGTIKANFPARIAFRVSSMIDSRTILDRPGANQLVGKGDMLYLQGQDPVRVQCAFVDTPEIERI
ncbi:MAG: DNA translocase FtsK 4TM domain-containing protein, partial [Bacteroidaceae bacterium]